ncbi:MAG: maltotransferase domain-containing protein [Ilumatobacteraceae bacterium]
MLTVVERKGTVMPVLPSTRPSRVVVEPVRPIVDGGRFAAKATVGEPTAVVADVFTDGHSLVAAAVRYRQADLPGASWHEVPATSAGNDRFEAAVVFSDCGVWEYEVLGWIDHFEGWRRDTRTKIAAGVGVDVELQAGVALLEAMLPNASGADRTFLEAARRDLAGADATVLDDASWPERSFRCSPRDPIARVAPLRVDVDPVYGAFGAWYEFFPRSTVSGLDGFEGAVGGDLEAARKRLDYVSSLGFDIVYLPPISPIGITKRKGRNNSTEAAPDDVGSPWAIGSADGGHTAVSPELGTVDDVVALVDACHERGLRLALDIAFQCSPDHPWVTEHPQWFAHRADGTIQYAENPPKKYEDIYPLDFETEDWRSLWEALADVFRFWIERGVRVFRVDNPHTKAIAFWEWALGTLRSEYPDTVFLAEAFTRPRVMERLAKVGFSQSYTYFTWRQGSDELADYFEDLSTRTVDFFRPNAWPNTPDILTEQLQRGGRAAFVTRAVLAATLSPSWGCTGRRSSSWSTVRSGKVPRSTTTRRSTKYAIGSSTATTRSPRCSLGSTRSEPRTAPSGSSTRFASIARAIRRCSASPRWIAPGSHHRCSSWSTSTSTTLIKASSTSISPRWGSRRGATIG